MIFDPDQAHADEIRIDNERMNISSPKVAMRHGLAYVPIYLSPQLLQECA